MSRVVNGNEACGRSRLRNALIAGALLICLGVALLAMYGYGGGPFPRLDLVSFSLVIVGSGISGLLPKLR